MEFKHISGLEVFLPVDHTARTWQLSKKGRISYRAMEPRHVKVAASSKRNPNSSISEDFVAQGDGGLPLEH